MNNSDNSDIKSNDAEMSGEKRAAPEFKLANSLLFSFILAALFVVLIIVGYSYTTKIPNPIKMFIIKQDTLIEQNRNTDIKINNIQHATEKALGEITRVYKLLQNQGTTTPAISNNGNATYNRGACDTEVMRLINMIQCNEKLDCPGLEYQTLRQHKDISADKLISKILLYIDTISEKPIENNPLSGFVSISRSDSDTVNKLMLIIKNGIGTEELNYLSSIPELQVEARAMREKMQYTENIKTKFNAQLTQIKHICFNEETQ